MSPASGPLDLDSRSQRPVQSVQGDSGRFRTSLGRFMTGSGQAQGRFRNGSGPVQGGFKTGSGRFKGGSRTVQGGSGPVQGGSRCPGKASGHLPRQPASHRRCWCVSTTEDAGVSAPQKMLVCQHHRRCWCVSTTDVGVSAPQKMLVCQHHRRCWCVSTTEDAGVSAPQQMLVCQHRRRCWCVRVTLVVCRPLLHWGTWEPGCRQPTNQLVISV